MRYFTEGGKNRDPVIRNFVLNVEVITNDTENETVKLEQKMIIN